MERRGLQEVPNRTSFVLEWLDAFRCDPVSQEVELCNSNDVFSRIDCDAIVTESLQHFPQVSLVHFHGNEEVVDICTTEGEAL